MEQSNENKELMERLSWDKMGPSITAKVKMKKRSILWNRISKMCLIVLIPLIGFFVYQSSFGPIDKNLIRSNSTEINQEIGFDHRPTKDGFQSIETNITSNLKQSHKEEILQYDLNQNSEDSKAFDLKRTNQMAISYDNKTQNSGDYQPLDIGKSETNSVGISTDLSIGQFQNDQIDLINEISDYYSNPTLNTEWNLAQLARGANELNYDRELKDTTKGILIELDTLELLKEILPAYKDVIEVGMSTNTMTRHPYLSLPGVGVNVGYIAEGKRHYLGFAFNYQQLNYRFEQNVIGVENSFGVIKVLLDTLNNEEITVLSEYSETYERKIRHRNKYQIFSVPMFYGYS